MVSLSVLFVGGGGDCFTGSCVGVETIACFVSIEFSLANGVIDLEADVVIPSRAALITDNLPVRIFFLIPRRFHRSGVAQLAVNN